MPKTLTSVNFDTEVIEWARVHIENISAVCNDALKILMEHDKSPTVRMEDMPQYETELNGLLTRLDALTPAEIRLRILKELSRIAQMKAAAKFAGIIELEGIRPDQAANTDFLLGLVTVLREKYPALARVDLKQLRDYLETREATT